jgi:hypothetical protein
MRYRDWKSSDLDRAKRAMRDWRGENPQGNAEQLIADIAEQFHPDYGVVLRGLLFAVDRQTARRLTPSTTVGARWQAMQ